MMLLAGVQRAVVPTMPPKLEMRESALVVLALSRSLSLSAPGRVLALLMQ